MNWHRVFGLWTGVVFSIALFMVLLNPWFENRSLLKKTFIPLVIGLVMLTLIVGEVI